jgi:hypothetical protein
LSLIDVSILLSDPNFVRAFTRRRPTVTISSIGVVSTTYADTAGMASIQPIKQADVEDKPEGTRIVDPVTVYSNIELRGGPGVEPDLVVDTTLGKQYRVVAVKDWGLHGFYQAIAEGFTP